MRIWGKFALGLGLMSAGFCILTLSARWSAMYGHSSLPLMVLGLAVMGFAELFIDPVAMSQITRIEIHWRDWRINWHLYAAFRRDCELSGWRYCRSDIAGFV
ncbi:hypothetical protein OH690_07305 [Escherichia coli]|nr:hypothetical protein [Escherichia coli]